MPSIALPLSDCFGRLPAVFDCDLPEVERDFVFEDLPDPLFFADPEDDFFFVSAKETRSSPMGFPYTMRTECRYCVL